MNFLSDSESAILFFKTAELCDRPPFGIEICALVTHGCNDSRKSEQSLNCHYIHAFIHQTGRESVTQLVPRNTFKPGLSACESMTRIQINKGISGFVVVENELVFSSKDPSLQNSFIITAGELRCAGREANHGG